jgi:outer membrane lipoprotein-sorting protein
VAAAAISTTNGAGASEQPKLPPITAAQLLAKVEQMHPTSLTGTIVETAKLGLPDLPTSDLAGAGDLSLQSLLTGSHTMRVWYGGPDQQRVAILAPMSERDVIHNGTDLWSYTSTTNEVTHTTVKSSQLPSVPKLEATTPQQAAQEALRAVNPTTLVTIDRTARVAGQAAYQLDLTPRDSRSLIGSIRIAIDAASSMPLQVQVFAVGSTTPALQVGFTDISFSAPSASVFDFVPPAGATVAQQKAPGSEAKVPDGSPMGDGANADTHPTVLGAGWTSVVELPSTGAINGSNTELLDRLSTPVPGGRLISTALVSVLVTNDGHIFAGPVSGSALQTVAATGHGL